MENLFCREQETKVLEGVLKSNESQFLAIYGRRRVGKTYLVNTFCEHKKCFFFSVTGLKDGSLSDQLSIFSRSVGAQFYDNAQLLPKSSWMDAFYDLTQHLKTLSHSKKIVLFFDELPWLATSRSGFIQALDHIWNTQWALMDNVKLIVCGSAASWMIDNLIKAKGGLHNRVTHKLKIAPLNLIQTKIFLQKLGHKLSNKQILDLYMLVGGVPLYLKKVQKGLSVVQNIQSLCFENDAFLQGEFVEIFRSLFTSADAHQEIVDKLSQSRYGVSRKILLEKLSLSKGGGTFDKRINALEASGFIQSFFPYGRKRDVFYRVVDEYSLFYFKWIKPHIGRSFTVTHWHDQVKTPSFMSWAGYAFEGICMKHFNEIRKVLNIEHIGCLVGNWRYVPKPNKKETGAQIDLLFDRDDDAMTVCEVKYSQNLYSLTKDEARQFVGKIDCFVKRQKIDKQIFLALITTKGLKQNLWSEDLINSVVTLDDILR